MGIYIPNMEMPKPKLADTVYDAYIIVSPNGHAAIVVDNEDGMDSTEYPLVPVPPHGSAAIEKVISERISQIERWGESSYNHPFEWMSILGEEFGELCEAVNETCFMNGKHPERGGDENIIREATQIAAVAIAIIEDFLPAETAPTITPASEESEQ